MNKLIFLLMGWLYIPCAYSQPPISKNRLWMEKPRELFDGWYFESCTSLIQKQEVLQGSRKVGLSASFVSCADDFVADKNVLKYLPREEEQNQIIARFKEQETDENT